MGGLGSGRQSGLGLSVDKCHELHSIDLAWLRRRKLLKLGGWSTLRWSRAGSETGSIRLTLVQGGMMLNYRQRRGNDEWQTVNEVMPLIEAATRFGCSRAWFQCLSCRRGCRIIYDGAYFRCRKCLSLKYETQYEPAFARSATRARKIRERLGGAGGIDDFFPEKPKGMHRKTYERLRDEDERLQSQWARGIATRFGFKL